MLHQEIDAVLLARDRIRRFFRNALRHAHARHIQFHARRRTAVFAHRAGHHQARLQREALQGFKHLRRNHRLRHNSLHRSGAIAKRREQQLARRAQVVKPAAQGNSLPNMFFQFGDGGEDGNSACACNLCGFTHDEIDCSGSKSRSAMMPHEPPSRSSLILTLPPASYNNLSCLPGGPEL